VFNIEMKDCHVVYNSLGEDSFWCALETKKEIFKSLQKTQVLTLLGDNRHYRATMCARYLAKDPNVKSFIFDKTSSFMDEVGSIDYIGKGLGLPIYLDSFHGDIMGIDLGTTRCVLSITSGKRSSTDVIPIDNSSDLCMPTAISFVQEPPIVGKIAMRQLSVKPKSVIFDAKRAVLPTTPHIQNTSPSHDEISFTVEHGKSICQQPEFHNFSLEDITLILLQSIKDASRETRRHAVVTVPYQLEPFREFHLMKQDIEKAAKKANVKLLEIIRETDANLLYYASRHALKGKMNVLVVDIGGGTGILMIYKIFYSSAENVGGRRECFYGRMVDQLLFEKLQNIMRKYYGIDEDKIMKKRFQLLNACQNIKHNLSTVEETELDLSEFDPSVERFHKITREWFENNIMEKVALNPDNIFISGISEFQVKLEGCKSYCNIDYVFLAGGT
uniref:Uncharacterized protein n=1 Tax=Panagrolaimus sp. JU765 TaxID=591449 RepID=A0AC34QF99_9BILA